MDLSFKPGTMMRTIGVLAAILLAAGVASGAEAKTLVFCSSGSPEGFDPAPYTSSLTFDASSRALYNRLVELEEGTTRPAPGLAESWEISPDGLEYTFHLRQGVKFHSTADFTPTRPFNASDVIFSFERQMKPKSPYFGYAGGSWPYFSAMAMGALVKSLDRVDDATVKVVLARAEASFIADLAMDFGAILSKEYADKLLAVGNLENLDRQPVGTGPFLFAGYENGVAVHYKANPDYWRGKPAIDDLTFAITPDPATRLARLKAGECQIAADLPPAEIPALNADPSLSVLQMPGFDIGYLAFNTLQKPFDDARVRRALNMAIDKKALVDQVFAGAGAVAGGPVPPTIWGYDNTLGDDPYDPDGARKLLAEAGVKDLKMKLWAMPVPRPYSPDGKQTAELIKADFAKVGVAAEIVSFDWGEYLKRSRAKDRDGAVLLGWAGDNGDPDNFLSALLSCDAVGISNRAQWCDQPFQDLLTKAKASSDPAERAGLYKEALAMFKDKAPWAALAHSLDTVAMSKKVKGYRMDPLGAHNFAGADIAE
jgi:dipeptide transport system substrate-binding protein